MCELDRWLDDGGPPEEEEIMTDPLKGHRPSCEEAGRLVCKNNHYWDNDRAEDMLRAATGAGWLKNAQDAESVVDEARANAADEEMLRATDSWLIRNTLASAADEKMVREEEARWAAARQHAEAQCRISGVDATNVASWFGINREDLVPTEAERLSRAEREALKAALKAAADVALKAAAEAVAEMAKAFGEMARSMRAAWLELHPGEEKEGES